MVRSRRQNARSPGPGSGAGPSNIDQARAAYAAWSARDLDAFVKVFSEELEVAVFLRAIGPWGARV